MAGEPIDLEALAARVLRPDRVALAEVRAAVAGLVEPREAWITLGHCGLVPPRWIDATSSRFTVAARAGKARANERDALEKIAGHHVRAYPASVADAIVLAASAASACAAEGHAREAARRMGFSPDIPVLWRVEPRWRPTALRWKRFTYHFGFSILGEHGIVLFEVSTNARRFAQALRKESGHNGSVEGDVYMYEFWRLASTTAARVPPMLTGWQPWGRLVGERFADVPNPLDPWLRVWELGFGVDAINQDAIVLVTPHEDERSRKP
ncbi:MAG: hypothetical protein QM820_03545 [Minicystis sp.]